MQTSIELIRAGVVPMTIHGNAQVELELGGETYPNEVVVVSLLISKLFWVWILYKNNSVQLSYMYM